VDDETTAQLVGLAAEDLLPDMPNQIVKIGPTFLIAGVKNLENLKRASLDLRALEAFESNGHPHVGVFLYSREAYSADAGYAARMLFYSAGLREDPATGSANTGFVAYLREHTQQAVSTIVEQGFEINRPSRLYIEADESVRVGGRVFQVLEGHLI